MSEWDLTIFYLQIGLLAIFARIGGECTRRLRLPVIVGEILAGVFLGPTILRQLWPDLQAGLFPPDSSNVVALGGLTNLGATLFLLAAGMEVDLALVRREGRSALLVSLAGVVIPLGTAFVPAYFWPALFGQDASAHPIVFALFVGVALAITSLSVTTKVLIDLNLYRTPFGMLVITAAVIDDLIGWTVAAIVLALDNLHDAGSLTHWKILAMLATTVLFAGAMLSVGRWGCDGLLARLYRWCAQPGAVIGFVIGLALLGASFTQGIGMHGLFGAFLVGVAIGGSGHLRPETRESITLVVTNFLAPLFFARVGLGVNFVANFDWQVVTVVLVLACLGKVVGCTTAARWMHLPWRQAWGVGFAMNGRGGQEIILGLIALHEKIIDERLFVALAVMAVVTSSLSGLAVQRLMSHRTDSASPPATGLTRSNA